MRHVLGGYAKVIREDFRGRGASNVRDGIARARYTRLLIVKELDKNNDLSWSTIKELTSTSSVVEARKLYGPTENLQLRSKVAFDTNHLPKSNEPDRSIIRRLRGLPFRHVFAEDKKDEHLFEHLTKNESEGILSWIIEGAIKYYKDGLGFPKFLEDELKQYQASMDKHLAESWLNQSIYEVDLGTVHPSEWWVKTTDLFYDYQSYAITGGVKPLSIQEFSDFMETRGAIKDQKQLTVEENGTKKKERSMFWLNLKKREKEPESEQEN